MAMTSSSLASAMPRTPVESRPLKTRTSVDAEADALAARRRQQDVVVLAADLHVDDVVALVELHGDLAVAVDVDEVGQLVAAHTAGGRREHHVQLVPVLLVLGQRHDGGDALAPCSGSMLTSALPRAWGAVERQPPDLLLVDLAARGEEQHRRVRGGHKEARDEILARASACRSGPCRRAAAPGRSRAARA